MSRKPVGRVYQTAHTPPSPSCSRCATGGCRCCSGSARREPFRGAWALPGGAARARRDARGVDPPPSRGEGRRPRGRRTSSSSRRRATRRATRRRGSSRPPTSGSCRSASTRTSRTTRAGTRSTSCRRPPSTTARSCSPARERLRGKLSYSNVGFALAPADVHARRAARGLRRGARPRASRRRTCSACSCAAAVLEPTGERRAPGRAGGRPAEVFRFRDRQLAITDPFAALRPRR